MANTLTQSLLKNMLQNQNPSIDVQDPIIQDIAVNFGGNIIDEVDNRVKALSVKFSSNYLSNMSTSELDLFALNIKGMSRNRGSFASGYIYFIYKDLSNISIPANTIVATQDGAWEFYTTANIYISINDMQNYFNPLTNEYQIKVPIQSLNTGSNYNVSAYRITYAKSSVTPATIRIENREATMNGSDVESDADFISRVETSIAGFNLNTKAGIVQALRSISGVTDIKITKLDQQNAFNVYFLGDSPVADTVIKTAGGPDDRKVIFSNQISPIRYVDVVSVNGIVIPNSEYTLDSKGTELTLASTVPLNSGSPILVGVQYNLVAQDVKSFINLNLDLIGTKWNISEPFPYPIQVEVTLKPLSSLSGSSSSYYQQIISSIINSSISGYFINTLSSSNLENLISSNLSVSSIKISLNGYPSLTIPEGFYPFISSDLINVTVL